jgi:hypothetical protein
MSATREAPFDAPTLAEHLVSQQAKIFDRLECIMEDFSGRLIRAGQQITLVKARQQANDEKLNEERSLRVSLENQLEACQAELQRQKEELIDCKVERHALRCQVQEQKIRLAQQPETTVAGALPRLVSCRQHVPSGSKRYDDIVSMLNFIAENISLDRCAAMELQGRLVLHDDIVTLGRVLQWKMDFKKLDKFFISIPAEDADSFINLIKRVIQSQQPSDPRTRKNGNAPGSTEKEQAVDAQLIGQIAAQWKVITDANVEGAAPTVYILNEVSRRAIIIGDWPQSPSSPDSKGIDYTSLYNAYKIQDGASTRRVTDLTNFLCFVTENISFLEAVVFEPARSQIVLQDRVTHMITLSTFRRLRLNAGSYEGLFLCIPEEDADFFEAAFRSILKKSVTVAEVAQSLSVQWRALSPLQHGRRTYVLNESARRVMILDSWPDDSVLACNGMMHFARAVPERPIQSSKVTKIEEDELVQKRGIDEGSEMQRACVVNGGSGLEKASDGQRREPRPSPRSNCH